MSMPPRLTVVGAHERPDHYHLPQEATCYFWGEYTPYEHTNGKKWDFSPTNRLMSNFKKKLDRRGHADWKYKGEAIENVVRSFSKLLKWKVLYEQRVALVPMPPSKARNDPLYDPRMLEVLQRIARRSGVALDIRDCLSFDGTCVASHEANERPTPDDLYDALSFDAVAGRSQTPPESIFLFDDMLTTGAHYVAATRRLGEAFPGVTVVGAFLARRIMPNPFEDMEEF